MKSSYNLRSNSQNQAPPEQVPRRNTQKAAQQNIIHQIINEETEESVNDESEKLIN